MWFIKKFYAKILVCFGEMLFLKMDVPDHEPRALIPVEFLH